MTPPPFPTSVGRRPVVLFGTGPQPAMFAQYIESEGLADVVAFTVDEAYLSEESFQDRPLVAFEEAVERYPPKTYDMFVAIGYSQLNRLRRDKYFAAKSAGYRLATYISSQASYRSQYTCGDNSMIMEFASVHPFARIGSNVTMLSGSVVAHHSVVKSHSYLAVNSSVAGDCHLKNESFWGRRAQSSRGLASVRARSSEPAQS